MAFSEKNPVPIAAIGIIILAVTVVFALTASSLPIFAGSTYQAEFSDAGGLKQNDVVRVAGVNVGAVSGLEIDGTKVLVTFTIKHITLGDRTRASIKTRTLLGERYLNIEPAGGGELPGDRITLPNTQSPYSITDAVNDLTRQTGQIDTRQVAGALNAISGAFATTPDNVTATLDGITRLSETINSRDSALLDLLNNAEGTTAILRDRSSNLVRLVQDANKLLDELERRRDEIRAVLANSQRLFVQLRGLIQDNEAQIAPVLDRTNAVLANLQRNEGNITAAIKNLGPFARTLGEAVGSSPSFMGEVQNLVPVNLAGVPQLSSLVPGYLDRLVGTGATPDRAAGGLGGLLSPVPQGGAR